MTWITRAGEWFQRLFEHDLAPVLVAFLKQFTSDLGNAALAEGGAFAAQVIAGGSTKDAGQQLLDHLVTKGIDIAVHDALDVAMNAIRVHVTKLQADAQAAENPLSVPAELAAAPDTEATA